MVAHTVCHRQLPNDEPRWQIHLSCETAYNPRARVPMIRWMTIHLSFNDCPADVSIEGGR